MRDKGHYLLWLYLLMAATGCAMVQPVNAPPPPPITATLPGAPIVMNTPAPIPATFTPVGGASSTPEPVVLSPVMPPLPPVQLMETVTPTVDVLVAVPDFLQPAPVDVPFLETPPATTECGSDGLLFRSRFPSQVEGPWRNYHAYLPPCYGKDGRSYPVLYLFHGSIQNDAHWVDLGLLGHVEAGLREGRYPPFIIIMPDNGEIGNNTSGNDHSIEGITVNELIPYVDKKFCTWRDAAGRSIGGISRGGYWALMIAFRHEALFTAVSGHSSHLRYETDRAEYNPLSTYADVDLSHLNIWLDWGETDFLRTGQAQLRDSLQQINANLEVHVNPGGHNEAYWLVHLQEYLDWHASHWTLSRLEYPPCGARGGMR